MWLSRYTPWSRFITFRWSRIWIASRICLVRWSLSLSVQNLKLFPVDQVIRDRALLELSLRKFFFRAREGLLGYRVNVLFVLPQPGFEFFARLSNIGRVTVVTLNLIYTIACLKLIEFVLGVYQYVTQCLVGFHGHSNVVFLEDSFEKVYSYIEPITKRIT